MRLQPFKYLDSELPYGLVMYFFGTGKIKL